MVNQTNNSVKIIEDLMQILNGLPWKRIEIILLFLRLHPSTAFQTLLLTMMATSFLLRHSCPPVHFSSLIPRMSMFTLVISFDHFQFALIHGPDTPGSYAILLFTATDLASITSHIHNWVFFLLWLHPFILSWVISPLISWPYWAPTDLGHSSFSILSFCLFILFMGFSRQDY